MTQPPIVQDHHVLPPIILRRAEISCGNESLGRRRAALGKSVQNHHQANDDVRKLITACLRSPTRKHDRTTLSRACPLYMIVSTEG